MPSPDADPVAAYNATAAETEIPGDDTSDAAFAAAPDDLNSMDYFDADTGMNVAAGQTQVTTDTVTPMSASGWTYFGSKTVEGHVIPGGQLFGQVTGSGLYVHDAGGDFITWHNMCDWNIDQVYYYPSNGHYVRYHTSSTGTHNSCTDIGGTKYVYSPQFHARAGKTCTILYAEWRTDRVDAVCHTIHS
jgi:hypothetical protein